MDYSYSETLIHEGQNLKLKIQLKGFLVDCESTKLKKKEVKKKLFAEY